MSTPPAMPHVLNTYGRLPFALARGRGCRVTDTEGRDYLDALAGIAVNTLGHAHPDLVAAIADQAGLLIHCSNYYQNPLQEAVATRLCELSGMAAAFFCSTGLEANEGAIKIARKHGTDRGIERPKIIVCERAFHGRSLATLSAGGNRKIQAGFGPLVEGFERVPYNDLDAVRTLAADDSDIVAVMLEPVQGEGGVHPARAEYLRGLRAICDERGWLLMLDEVQSGIGRTGKWFAHQWSGIVPDVMQLAKGLGAGVPVGAILCGPRAKDVLTPGSHGTTFGGNPLAMRAALTTLDVMQRDDLVGNAARVGASLQAGLARAFAGTKGVKEVRGAGLMVGVELDRPCGPVLQRAADAGLLLSVTADSVIRIVPPLILTEAEAAEIVERLVPVVTAFLAETPAA